MSDDIQVKMTTMNYDKDRPKAQNPVKVEDLTLRDGHQSLFATRGRTEDMIPVAEMIDDVGFWAMEVWGGAIFDTMHRFLNEDPWERIRTLKRYVKKTPFSMLLRGQNLVGYRNYADDDYFEVAVDEVGGSPVVSYVQPMATGMQMPAAAPPVAPAAAAAAVEGTPVAAPMPGMIVKYEKEIGDSVSQGETVVVLEAMKMENALPAPSSGTVKSVNFSSGDLVAKGDVLCVIG